MPKTHLPKISKEPKNEKGLQMKVINWFRVTYPDANACRIKGEVNIRNKGLRGAIIGEDCNMGYESGTPDWILLEKAVFRSVGGKQIHYGAFFIEFKHPNGKGYLKPHQYEKHEALRASGYCVRVVDNYDEGIKAIATYMDHAENEKFHGLWKEPVDPQKTLVAQSIVTHIKKPQPVELDSDVEEIQ